MTDPSLEKIVKEAFEDEEYQTIVKAFLGRKQVTDLPEDHPARRDAAVWDNIALDDSNNLLLYSNRIIVPAGYRKTLLELLHLSHSGITKTRELAKHLYYWPGITTDIKKMVESCSECQRSKPSLPRDANIHTTASTAMESVSADLFQAAGKHYLVMVDRYSGFPFVSKLKRLDTHTVVAKMTEWFQDWGIPRSMRTDGGPQFRQEFSQFCRRMGILQETSSPYNPESN